TSTKTQKGAQRTVCCTPFIFAFTLFVAAVLQSVLLKCMESRQHLTKQRCYCSTSSQSGRDVPAIKNLHKRKSPPEGKAGI
ncbi:MAG: hypothetical protein WAV42_10700, partial [Gemmiger qucibialis]